MLVNERIVIQIIMWSLPATHLIPQSNVFRYDSTVYSSFITGSPDFRNIPIIQHLFMLSTQARTNVLLQHLQPLLNASDLVVALDIYQLHQLSHYLRSRAYLRLRTHLP